MRIAYFVTSYQSSQMLVRLLRTLRRADPDCALVVHHDRFRSDLDEAELTAVGDVLLVTSDHPIVWGDMTLESARWRVFDRMLAEVEFDWCVLLSEQDYPVRPLGDLSARLASSDADAIMDLTRLDDVPDRSLRREHQRRYLYRYRTVPSLPFAVPLPARVRRTLRDLRVLAFRTVNKVQDRVRIYWFPEALRLPVKVGVKPRRSPFGPDFACWVNSSWFAVSRRAVERTSAFVRENPAYVEYFSRTVFQVEAATATILANDPALVVENASLHHIRWSAPKTGRPDLLGADAIDELVGSGLPFARKFDPADRTVLDLLDERVFADEPVPSDAARA